MQKTYKLEKGVQSVIHDIQEQSQTREGTIIVLVAGGTASGKTSAVAKKINDACKGSQILSMDNYYRGWDYYKKYNLNFDQPEALNLDLFYEHLETLKSGKSVKIPEYDFKVGKPEFDKILIEPSRVIIVEGLFALDDKLAKLGDMRVFVDLGVHSQILRRLFRDVQRTGQNPAEILKYFLEVVYEMHKKYIEPTKNNAQVILQNDYTPEAEAKNARIRTDRLKYKFEGEQAKETLAELVYKLGGTYVGELEETDYFFDPTGVYKQTGEILTIKKIGFNRYFFSYLGPDDVTTKRDDRYVMRFFTDFETLQDFKTMYPKNILELSRIRRSFFLGGVLVCLDEYENGDTYIVFKFEGRETKDEIAAILRGLNLQPKDFTTKTYYQIYS